MNFASIFIKYFGLGFSGAVKSLTGIGVSIMLA